METTDPQMDCLRGRRLAQQINVVHDVEHDWLNILGIDYDARIFRRVRELKGEPVKGGFILLERLLNGAYTLEELCRTKMESAT